MTAGEVKRDEQELIERARQGDRDAFADLVWRHQDTVHTLAMRLVGPDLAADVAQEALIRAWRALPRFRGEAAFSTWLHRITVNTAWTLRKRAARHQAQQLEGLQGVEVERLGESFPRIHSGGEIPAEPPEYPGHPGVRRRTARRSPAARP